MFHLRCYLVYTTRSLTMEEQISLNLEELIERDWFLREMLSLNLSLH